MTHRDRAGDPSGQWAGRRGAADRNDAGTRRDDGLEATAGSTRSGSVSIKGIAHFLRQFVFSERFAEHAHPFVRQSLV